VFELESKGIEKCLSQSRVIPKWTTVVERVFPLPPVLLVQNLNPGQTQRPSENQMKPMSDPLHKSPAQDGDSRKEKVSRRRWLVVAGVLTATAAAISYATVHRTVMAPPNIPIIANSRMNPYFYETTLRTPSAGQKRYVLCEKTFASLSFINFTHSVS